MDPSRTGLLRRRFEISVTKRLKQLQKAVRELIVDEDAFGLKQANRNVFANNSIAQTANTRWKFNTSAEKAEEFKRWLSTQIKLVGLVSEAEDAYYRAYIKEGYRKGMERIFDDTHKAAMQDTDRVRDFYEGSKQEFLRSAFDNPQSLEKVKLLSGRTFTDLKNVTEAMSTQMSRTLLDGFTRGENPLTIARQMVKDIDGIGIKRARTIARTEIIRAHAEGELDSLERQGAEKVGVMSEWHTAGDDRVCQLCLALDGVVLKIKEARGLLPRHPNCRCAFVPANVGEDRSKQKRSKTEIEAAFDETVRRELPKRKKRTLAEQKKRSSWSGIDRKVAAKRPKSILGDYESKTKLSKPWGAKEAAKAKAEKLKPVTIKDSVKSTKSAKPVKLAKLVKITKD